MSNLELPFCIFPGCTDFHSIASIAVIRMHLTALMLYIIDFVERWPAVSIFYHRQRSFPVSGLQSQKQGTGILDVSLGAILSGLSQGNSRRMIRAADESQSLGQTP